MPPAAKSLEYVLSLDYGKIALVTNGIDGSGNPVKNGEFGYDVTNHTEIAPFSLWPAPGSEDTELGVILEPEVVYGTQTLCTRIQA